MNVLIVEDDFVSRRVLETFFNKMSNTFTAVNGLEAVDYVRDMLSKKMRFDLICMDIMMPEMDGFEALKAIRKMEKEAGIRSVDETKVLMITALEHPKDVVKAYYECGATDYLSKPLNFDDLEQKLQNMGLS